MLLLVEMGSTSVFLISSSQAARVTRVSHHTRHDSYSAFRVEIICVQHINVAQLVSFASETKSHCISQDGLELRIVLPQLPSAGITAVNHHT
jgi:hypothetical protein